MGSCAQDKVPEEATTSFNLVLPRIIVTEMEVPPSLALSSHPRVTRMRRGRVEAGSEAARGCPEVALQNPGAALPTPAWVMEGMVMGALDKGILR